MFSIIFLYIIIFIFFLIIIITCVFVSIRNKEYNYLNKKHKEIYDKYIELYNKVKNIKEIYNNKIEEDNENFDKILQQINNNIENINELRTHIEELNKHIYDIESNLTTIKKNIDKSINQNIDKINFDINTISSKYDNIIKYNETIEKQYISEKKTLEDNLNKRFEEINKNIENIENDNIQKSSFEEIKKKITDIQNLFLDINSDIKKFKDFINSKIDEIEGSIKNINIDLKNKTEQISDIQNSILNLNSNLKENYITHETMIFLHNYNLQIESIFMDPLTDYDKMCEPFISKDKYPDLTYFHNINFDKKIQKNNYENSTHYIFFFYNTGPKYNNKDINYRVCFVIYIKKKIFLKYIECNFNSLTEDNKTILTITFKIKQNLEFYIQYIFFFSYYFDIDENENIINEIKNIFNKVYENMPKINLFFFLSYESKTEFKKYFYSKIYPNDKSSFGYRFVKNFDDAESNLLYFGDYPVLKSYLIYNNDKNFQISSLIFLSKEI